MKNLAGLIFCFQAFNLVEGIDVEAIEAKIARYQQENAEQIYLSRAKRVCFVMIPDVVFGVPKFLLKCFTLTFDILIYPIEKDLSCMYYVFLYRLKILRQHLKQAG